MAMHRIEKLRDNYEYPAARRVAFEDMCTLVFCEYLRLPRMVKTRVDQRGVESDPVVAVDPETGVRKWFAYQVKYFDDGTELRNRASEFRDSIDVARELGADVLMLFVNKDCRDTKKERVFEAKLEAYAKGYQVQPTVRLDWWTLSTIEKTLALPRYSHIPDRFLGSNVGAFYKAVHEQFYGDTGGELYGEVPLSECYIEPTVDVEGMDGANLTAREWVELFVDGNGKVAVLCGEPGHGKTSLCRKATCDFYKSGWLAGKVSNVFCFSLNPANTDAVDHASLDFYSLFSWGPNRRNSRNKLEPEHCRNALVFLDGFDELLEWKPGLDLEGFIREYVSSFQRETESHVIVTTRNMVVDPDSIALQIDRRNSVPVVRLQLISKSRQVGWIEEYAERLRGKLASSPEPSSQGQRTEVDMNLVKLDAYTKQYSKLDEDADFQKILGIPIIFRMVVAARYLPKESQSTTRIYDDLFDITWDRHMHDDASLAADQREIRKQLSRHALRIYANDADTASVNGVLEMSWPLAFYTTRQGGMHVGFLHRSFYQHFLAREVLSWFVKYADKENRQYDKKTFHTDLSYLARRRLDETTLCYIRDMHDGITDEEGFDKAFNKAYEILKETDGFLPLPKDERDAVQIKVMAPLERANNVFWNVVSVCSICGHELKADKVNASTLQSYKLDGCHLENAQLEGADLRRADLRSAHLYRANLRSTRLERANLSRADLELAQLTRAYLEQANLVGVCLANADLEWAHLTGAHLKSSDLIEANLEGAQLTEAHLEGAHLRRADLRGARLVRADLRRADLRGAHLEQAWPVRARLEGARLEGAHLVGADLREANLRGAHFDKKEHLERTRLKGTNLEGIVFMNDE